MQVTCGCGKVLNVPETLMGKTARCPQCKKILQMPGAPPAAAPSRIVVECTCGKKLAAPLAAAGKKVLCPKCNAELTVPAPQPGASQPATGPLPQKAAAPAPPKKPSSPVIVPMPGPASYTAKPAEPTRTPPPMSEDLTFDVEAPPPEPPKSAPVHEDSPGGKEEQAQYGLGGAKCPHCKADMALGAQFCIECGTALATGAKINAAIAPPTKKKKGISVDPVILKKVAIGVVVLAAVGAGGYFGYNYFKAWRAKRANAAAAAAAAAQPAPVAAPRPLRETLPQALHPGAPATTQGTPAHT